MMGYLRLIVPALDPSERIGMLSGMRGGMPPAAFEAVMDGAVRATLPLAEAAAVETALGLRHAA